MAIILHAFGVQVVGFRGPKGEESTAAIDYRNADAFIAMTGSHRVLGHIIAILGT